MHHLTGLQQQRKSLLCQKSGTGVEGNADSREQHRTETYTNSQSASHSEEYFHRGHDCHVLFEDDDECKHLLLIVDACFLRPPGSVPLLLADAALALRCSADAFAAIAKTVHNTNHINTNTHEHAPIGSNHTSDSVLR